MILRKNCCCINLFENAKLLFFNGFIHFNSPTFNGTKYVNVTIYKRQPDCRIPDDFMYTTVDASEKNPRINCPRSEFYNWTAPLEWFKVKGELKGNS